MLRSEHSASLASTSRESNSFGDLKLLDLREATWRPPLWRNARQAWEAVRKLEEVSLLGSPRLPSWQLTHRNLLQSTGLPRGQERYIGHQPSACSMPPTESQRDPLQRSKEQVIEHAALQHKLRDMRQLLSLPPTPCLLTGCLRDTMSTTHEWDPSRNTPEFVPPLVEGVPTQS